MKKSFIVIGLGRFGSSVAKKLAELKSDVLAVDIKEENVTKVSKTVTNCVIADGTRLDILEELGAKAIDHAIVAIGNNFQASIMAIINLKKLGVKSITVRADSEDHRQVYELIGATEVIIPEEDSAISLANQVTSDSIIDYYEVSGDYAMVKITIGKKIDKSLIELDVRNKFGINIVGIINKDAEFYIPRGTDKLKQDEVAVVCGAREQIRKFDNFLNN